MEHYMINIWATKKHCDSEGNFIIHHEIEENFKYIIYPRMLMTNVGGMKLVEIRDVKINGKAHLVHPIDAYHFSAEINAKIITDFHNSVMARLAKMLHRTPTTQEFDKFCEEEEIAAPIPRFELPPLKAGTKIELSGKFLNVRDEFVFVVVIQGRGEALS